MSHYSPHSQSETYASTSGIFNSGRRVPPPRPLPHSSSSRDRHAQTSDLPHPMSSTILKIADHEFREKVLVKVDEATEPGTSNEDASRYRRDIANFIRGRNVPRMPTVPLGTKSGEVVVFALRKRLKSADVDAVLNTLVLLDELMRTVPYFYRYVADDRFFRRLWRFVDHNYKNQVMSFLKSNRSRTAMYMGSFDSEITDRVKILIRAWAEELSKMFPGQVDPKAGFLIERYRKKSSRMTFPEVPKTDTPWVCPVASKTNNRRLLAQTRGAGSSSSNQAGTWTLDQLENTVTLFNSLVDSASNVDDVKGDACVELAERCRRISGSLMQITVNMNDEEDLARAVSISELVQSSLEKYNSLLKGENVDNLGNNLDRIMAIPSDDEPDSYSSDEDDRTTSRFQRIRLRSDEGVASDPVRSHIRRSNSMDNSPYATPTSSRGPTTVDEGPSSRDLEPPRELHEKGVRSRKEEHMYDRRSDSEQEPFPKNEQTRTRNHDPEFSVEASIRRSINRDRGYESDEVDSEDVSDSSDSSHSRERKARAVRQKPKGTTVKSSEINSRSKTGDVKKNQKSELRRRLHDEKRKVGNSDGSRKEETLISISTGESMDDKGDSKNRRKKDPHRKKKERSKESNDIRKQPVNPVEGSSSNTPIVTSAGSVGNGSNMYPFYSSYGSYGMNNFLVPPNPFTMYSSMNLPEMRDPMKMMQAYATVNPAAYYSNMNPLWSPVTSFNPMNPYISMQSMGMVGPSTAPQMQGESGTRNQHATATNEVEGENQGTSVDNRNESREPYVPHLTASGQPYSGAGMPSIPLANPMHQTPVVPMRSPSANSSTSWNVSGSDPSNVSNGVESQGLTKEEAEMRAAEYQSTMQQAAAMYKLAENGYRTMQGHAAIAQSPNLSRSPQETPNDSSKTMDNQTHDKQE